MLEKLKGILGDFLKGKAPEDGAGYGELSGSGGLSFSSFCHAFFPVFKVRRPGPLFT